MIGTKLYVSPQISVFCHKWFIGVFSIRRGEIEIYPTELLLQQKVGTVEIVWYGIVLMARDQDGHFICNKGVKLSASEVSSKLDQGEEDFQRNCL